ncbi:SDR family NAD(P)-dependent oxidoreductase [Ostreibacterium oceani]|uniref:SDR family NAD(P)-dependent oxidoreductase n=1 Tax=Ostreibacterium oceani TaxID=2654998 RepID=UPI00128E6ED3|nr:SDR family NAD(P)-dependent oxidoreductase [Ostreibacterium oceani]
MKPEIFKNTPKADDISLPQLLSALNEAPQDLSHRYILITGATRGIGLTLSYAAAAYGASVILLDNSIAALENTFNQIMTLPNAKEPLLLPIDLAGANYDHYVIAHEQLTAHIPHLDSIIHNAAHFDGLYALLQTPPDTLIKQIQVNYTASIWLTQTLFPLLRQSTSPTLLFADHEEAYAKNTAYWSTYAGSKSALMQAVKQIALEHGDSANLFAYGYNTGWVNTQLARAAYPNADATWPDPMSASIAQNILTLLDRPYANGHIINAMHAL